MPKTVAICPRIVEGLYCEALILAEEVRAAFALSGRIEIACEDEDLARIALSCEGLRTTTRMMHAMAWLLNHRSHFLGELSEFQLRRSVRLVANLPAPDPDAMLLLGQHQRDVVAATERFYARLQRLDRSWRDAWAIESGAIERIRARIGQPRPVLRDVSSSGGA
jgi:regulator of CtrA degradation